MPVTSRDPFPSPEEFDRLLHRCFTVPLCLWGAALLVIVVDAVMEPPAPVLAAIAPIDAPTLLAP